VELRFSVRDTGPGIPEDKQAMIFGLFCQADGSNTRRHDGTGLGLAISARLVEMMGGRIWLESKPGSGSTFYFTVRLRARRDTEQITCDFSGFQTRKCDSHPEPSDGANPILAPLLDYPDPFRSATEYPVQVSNMGANSE
jgi:hypothetical protein